MKATVFPGPISGTIDVPPSKSMAHRAIIAASLSLGSSVISNLDYSEDILATIDCMRILGANIHERSHTEHGRKTIEITGIKDIHSLASHQLDCKESGSTLRFLIPLVALTDQTMELYGHNRLLHRPQSVYETIFAQQDLPFLHTTEKLAVTGPLRPAAFSVRGDVSSQFISGLLFALPLLDQDSSLMVEYPYESRSYVELTIQILQQFGIVVHQQIIYNEDNLMIGYQYHIPGNQRYEATSYHVEGDYSQLAFFGVLGAIHSPVSCIGVDHNSIQGDREVLSILQMCGAAVLPIKDGYSIGPGTLHAATIDIQDCPDLGPILMILGMFSSGTLRLVNTSRLRIKESDRAAAMADGLHRLGAKVDVYENEIVIHQRHEKLQATNLPIEISGYRDHRIVMSFAIAATRYSHPITVTDANAINKSYPRFFEDIQRLGIEVHFHD